MSDSALLNGLLSTTTENPLEVIKRQQEQIQRQLLHQEFLNNNIYQSLLNSGFIQNGNIHNKNFQLTTTSTQPSLLNLLKNRQFLNGLETTASPTSLFSLASIFPLFEGISSLGDVFEKLFGTKFWIYAFLAIIVGIMFIIVTCFCMYCCCCNSLGRTFCKCCCKLSKLKKNRKKKKKEVEFDDKKSKSRF
ncbi:hypothetical protein BpHYR1_051496 [Brachionus plicatilis]|uniref:Uncharacterized protein n=1 Tax=Brachionus plicatilis TaxID=10195 RepID=A0A3M7R9N6_BRAPC|nr:hypothetical protein BpHYR1_051496 [Brachionus plicatilis]